MLELLPWWWFLIPVLGLIDSRFVEVVCFCLLVGSFCRWVLGVNYLSNILLGCSYFVFCSLISSMSNVILIGVKALIYLSFCIVLCVLVLFFCLFVCFLFLYVIVLVVFFHYFLFGCLFHYYLLLWFHCCCFLCCLLFLDQIHFKGVGIWVKLCIIIVCVGFVGEICLSWLSYVNRFYLSAE